MPPGPYSVELATRVDGVVTVWGEPRTFQVKRLREGTLPGASPEKLTAFLRRLDQARGRMFATEQELDRLGERVTGLFDALARASLDDTGLRAELRALHDNLMALRLKLEGDKRRDNFGAGGPVPIARRLDVVVTGTAYSTYGPTPSLSASLELAELGLDQSATDLSDLRVALTALEQRFDAAGVPWTPGRPLGSGR